MPSFAYRAVDTVGNRRRGTEDADSPLLLTRSLERRGLLVLEVTEAASPDSQHGGFGRRRSVIEVTRALASLLAAGMPLARALDVAGELAERGVAEALASVQDRVRRGDALHAALGEHSRFFGPLYTGVVRAGERSGDLVGAFRRLEAQLEREQELRSRLVSASIYPVILAIAGGVAVLVLTLFVLPRFTSLLLQSGATLPTSTRILMALSGYGAKVWPVLVVAPPAIVLTMSAWLTTESGRRAVSRTALVLPGIRALRREALAARFARLMSVLLSGGAPLLEALDDAAESLGDPVARDDAIRIRLRVREGAPLNQGLAEGDVFPPLLARLVAVGEESARLEEFLGKASEMFEVRVTRATERLASLVEPAMIVFFGGVVGLVALSLLQAIYGVNAGALR